MKIKNFFYKLSGSFILASSLSFTIGSIAFISFKELLKNNDSITRSYKKINKLEQITTDITDTETSVRGYIITGKEVYLQPYYQALTTIDEHINEYKLYIRTSEEQAKFNKIIELKDKRLKVLEEGLKIRKEKGFAAVLKITDIQKGRRLMVEIKTTVEVLNSIETNKLALRKEQSENLVIVSRLSIVATALLNLLILVMAYNLVQEEVKHREIIEKKLLKANRALSFSVKTATEELDNYFQSGYERKLELEKLNNSLKSLNLEHHE